MLRCKSCLKTIETNKAEFKDANEDKVEDFNEDTCNVCAYDFYVRKSKSVFFVSQTFEIPMV